MDNRIAPFMMKNNFNFIQIISEIFPVIGIVDLTSHFPELFDIDYTTPKINILNILYILQALCM